MPWNGITPEAGVKLMKHALDNGANFWNGVSYTLPQMHLRTNCS